MVISTNLSAQMAATQLDQSSQLLSKSLAELSSGSKITSPADDSAGLAVSMNFTAQIDNAGAAVNNLNDAISFSQTQDGYLQQVASALDRMGELAVQAQDVTKSSSERSLYNSEFQSLASYVNSVGNQSFNGISLFSGNTMNVTSDTQGSTVQLKGISGSFLPPTTTTTTTTTTTEGYAANTTLGQVSSTFNGTSGDQLVVTASSGTFPSNTLSPSSTISDLVNFLQNDSNGWAGASYDASTGQLSITVQPGHRVDDNPLDFFDSSTDLYSDLNLPADPFGMGGSTLDNSQGSSPLTVTTTLTHSVTTTTTTTSNSVLDISSIQNAASALTSVQSALAQVASDRAQVGTNIEQMNFASEQLDTLQENLSAANSSITDVDVAQASTNYAQENILVQAGTAMLAQANALPQLALKLIE